MRFGLDGSEPLTLREIGKQIGLTRERVRQIEVRAFEKVQEAMHGQAGVSVDTAT